MTRLRPPRLDAESLRQGSCSAVPYLSENTLFHVEPVLSVETLFPAIGFHMKQAI